MIKRRDVKVRVAASVRNSYRVFLFNSQNLLLLATAIVDNSIAIYKIV